MWKHGTPLPTAVYRTRRNTACVNRSCSRTSTAWRGTSQLLCKLWEFILRQSSFKNIFFKENVRKIVKSIKALWIFKFSNISFSAFFQSCKTIYNYYPFKGRVAHGSDPSKNQTVDSSHILSKNKFVPVPWRRIGGCRYSATHSWPRH
jgi:hypothetical protein